MKQLMISLDKKILDPASAVAERMVTYGQTKELFIIIPSRTAKSIDLSENVHVWSTGGNRLQQYFRLKKLGRQIVDDYKIKHVTVQDPSFIGTIGGWLKKKTGATLEVQVHGDFYSSNYYKKNLKDYIGYFIFGKHNIRAADQVRVVGDRQRASLVALGIPSHKIIKRPVPIQIGTGRKQIDFLGFEKVFLSLGRLEPVKNLSWLIEVFGNTIKQYRKNYLLLIVGEGSQRERLQAQVKRQGLEKNIVFKNWTSDPGSYQRSVDAILIPSLSESYGLVAMEAVALGTSVIMNDVGVANYELPPNDRVKILSINDRTAWEKAILSC